MNDIKNERIFAAKPYDMIRGVSIFPLNENGVRNYLKNKLVDNQIIKKYGTMDILENFNLSKEKLKENIGQNLTQTKSFAVNQGKTFSNWNDDFLLLKNKFKDDLVKIDNMIEVIKDKNNNSIIRNKNTSIDHNPNSKNLNELTKKFSKMNSKDKIIKSNRKLVDGGFTSSTIPRLDTCDEKIKNKYFLKLMRNNKQEDYDLTRYPSSNIFPKVLNDRRGKDTSREKNYAKITTTWNLIKTTQPEFVYNSNLKGDCKMMGEKYNPFNYYVDNTRTAKRRNLYGSVYNN